MSSSFIIDKKMNEVVEISKKIIDIFKQLEKYELDNVYRREMYKKPLEELRNLLNEERKVYYELSKLPELVMFTRETLSRPKKFQMKYDVSSSVLSRILLSLVSFFRFEADKNKKEEFGFNILSNYNEFIGLEFPEVNHENHVFDSISEEIYREYLNKISEKIRDAEYKDIREDLIEKKFRILKMTPSTNPIYLKTFAPRRSESKIALLLKMSNLSPSYFEYIQKEYVINFFDLFFKFNLELTDEEIHKREKYVEMVDKLSLVEVMFEFLDQRTRNLVELMFYRSYYKINREKEINNKVITSMVENILESNTYSKKKIRN